MSSFRAKALCRKFHSEGKSVAPLHTVSAWHQGQLEIMSITYPTSYHRTPALKQELSNCLIWNRDLMEMKKTLLFHLTICGRLPRMRHKGKFHLSFLIKQKSYLAHQRGNTFTLTEIKMWDSCSYKRVECHCAEKMCNSFLNMTARFAWEAN